MQDRGTVSLLILPLVVRKQVIGTIGLDAIEARSFSTDEIELAAAVASTAAQAIDTARLFAETRRRAGELEAVAEVSSAMRTATTRAEMYPIILNQLLFLLTGRWRQAGVARSGNRGDCDPACPGRLGCEDRRATAARAGPDWQGDRQRPALLE